MGEDLQAYHLCNTNVFESVNVNYVSIGQTGVGAPGSGV